MIGAVLAAILFAINPAHQPVTADAVDIVVESDVPLPEQQAIVVFSDGTRRLFELRNGHGRVDKRLINARSVTATVRFANGRTGCAKAARVRNEGGNTIAEFVLRWTQQPVWQSLKLDVDARSQPVSYVRMMAARCRDPAASFIGSGDLTSVVPYSESIFLHLGDPPLPLILYHLVIHRGAYSGQPIGTRPLSIRRETVINEYALRIGLPNADNLKDLVDRRRLPKDFKRITLSRSE